MKHRTEDEAYHTKRRQAKIDQLIQDSKRLRTEDELNRTRSCLAEIDVLQVEMKYRAEDELNRTYRRQAETMRIRVLQDEKIFIAEDEHNRTKVRQDKPNSAEGPQAEIDLTHEIEQYHAADELRRKKCESIYSELKAIDEEKQKDPGNKDKVEAGDKGKLNNKVEAGDKDKLNNKAEAGDADKLNYKVEAADKDKVEAGDADKCDAGDKDKLNNKVEAGDEDMLKDNFEAGDKGKLKDQFEAGEKDKLKDKFEAGDKDRLKDEFEACDMWVDKTDKKYDFYGRRVPGTESPLPPKRRARATARHSRHSFNLPPARVATQPKGFFSRLAAGLTTLQEIE